MIPSRHPRLIGAVFARFVVSRFVFAAALAGVGWLAGCSPDAVKPPPPVPTVTVAPVVREEVALYNEAVGNLDGYVNAEIRARARGILQTQRYKDGATVREGQILFTIDHAEYQAALDSAKAAVARAETAAAHNKAQLDRRKDLGAARVVSQQELEDAEAAAHDSADAVRAATAQLRQAQLNLSYTEIRSPVTGVAGLALVRAGNLVGQDGPTLLTTVSQVDPMRVSFPLGEIDYVRAAERLKQLDGRDRAWAVAEFAKLDKAKAAGQKPGANPNDDSLELVLSDGSAYPHRGVIVAVNRQVDATTGTIQLQALFPNPGNLLRPGQFGRVRMRRRDVGATALTVPEKALVQVQGTYALAVVGADNKVKLKRVEVGPSTGPSRIITSGVEAGERVIVEGVQKAPDGATVIVKAGPPPSVAAAAAIPGAPARP
ncbi:MAG: efflux system, rane fusion protein CmeA [Myxococcales bacterium]|nr:efflux system, rane fusion protein CmeA [Myxococcales bacterium]